MKNFIASVVSLIVVVASISLGVLPLYIGYLVAVNFGFFWFIIYIILGSSILALTLQTIILSIAIIFAFINKIFKN